MPDSKPALRKPVFCKVDQLLPGTRGHTIIVKVVSVKLVDQNDRPDGLKLRHMRMAECLVGDETGTIIFTARHEQGILITSTLLQVFLTASCCCTVIVFVDSLLNFMFGAGVQTFFYYSPWGIHVPCAACSIFFAFVGIIHVCFDVYYFLYLSSIKRFILSISLASVICVQFV